MPTGKDFSKFILMYVTDPPFILYLVLKMRITFAPYTGVLLSAVYMRPLGFLKLVPSTMQRLDFVTTKTFSDSLKMFFHLFGMDMAISYKRWQISRP